MIRPALALLAIAATLSAECSPERDRYVGYTVSDIRIQTLLDFPQPVRWVFRSADIASAEREAIATLPFAAGHRFERTMLARGQEALRDRYDRLATRPGERIRGALILPKLDECDDAARTVALVFRIYSTEAAYYASRLFESKPRLDRTLAIGDAAKASSAVFPLPFAGYDSARKLFGGLAANWTAANPIVQRVQMEAGGSARSHRTGFALSGFRNPAAGPLSHFEWRAAIREALAPAGGAELREATGLAQFSAASRAATAAGIVFRFGGQLEGGHRQSSLSGPGILANAPHAALKAYGGATFRTARNAWSASYGVQAGRASPEYRVDYRKQIVDLAYQGRLLWREHFPLRFEAQAGGGWIASQSGRVPAAERFYGGNAPPQFIEGDQWRIRAGPLLRSFPQNRLGAGPAGGTEFYSAGVTVAQTVWAKSTLPDAVRHSDELLDGINVSLDKVRLDGLDEYRLRTREMAAVVKQLDPLESQVRALAPQPSMADQIFALIGEAREDPRSEAARSNARALAVDDDSLLELLSAELRQAGNNEAAARFDSVRGELVRGLEAVERTVSLDASAFEPFAADRASLESLLARIETALPANAAVRRRVEAVRNAVPKPDEAGIDQLSAWRRVALGKGQLLPPQLERLALILPDAQLAAEVRNVQRGIRAKLGRLRLPPGERYTVRQTAYIPNTMDVVFRELNIASISPVALFDAARIGPATQELRGTRFGAGGGVRFSLVTFDITAGYAVNANRRPGEPRGALFFSLDVTDLFR
ncbi:MAG: hypothetical protein U0Q16_06840 [Bryobacteraceae bacterium]